MKDPDDLHRSPIATDDKVAVDSAVITVLLVDDSRTIRLAARQILEAEGYTVITARDGFEALSKVVEYRPSIMFVDIMMPRLDGYQTCALVKNNIDYRHIPVIMLSSKDGLFDKARARVVRSDAHLSKPLTEQGLNAAIRQHVVDVIHLTNANHPQQPSVANDYISPVV